MASRRNRKRILEENSNPSFNPSKVPALDMKHVPQCLLEEGYDLILKEDEEAIPASLKCPSCKELLVEPEIYPCGHTVCGECKGPEMGSCPVCKCMYLSTTPNSIIAKIIEEKYFKQLQKRKQDLFEMREMKKKLMHYPLSSRFQIILRNFNEYMNTNICVHYKNLIHHICSDTLHGFPVHELEAKYFVAVMCCKIQDVGVVGEYIISRNIDLNSLITWAEQKSENKKWLPLVFTAKPPQLVFCFEIYQRLANIYKVNIGKKLNIEEWMQNPADWLKDLELDLVFDISLDFSEENFFWSSSDEDDPF